MDSRFAKKQQGCASLPVEPLRKASASNLLQVGHTQRPCTKGLWMWSAPIEMIDPKTKKKYYLVGPGYCVCAGAIFVAILPIVALRARRGVPLRTALALPQILLDTEGIDATDQTGQYSTQIFSLAVLLSSLFVYNQVGGLRR